jgi:hypothetical protein
LTERDTSGPNLANLFEYVQGAKIDMGEVRVTSETGGQKGSKNERPDLIPPQQIMRLAAHYGFGARKYSDDNYRKGYDWRLSYAALQRHLNQFWMGEDYDEESGSLHLIAAAWHCFTLAEFFDVHPEYDTRLKTIDQRAVREAFVDRTWTDSDER